jgi:glycosyltransferase involved in cell wall biosynthesis
VIPAYNHEAFVAESVASALSQDTGALEVIVVDDGSTDRTAEVLEQFVSDPRFTMKRQANVGAHASLNCLLEEARGRFIFILDSDDLFEPDRLQRLAASLEGDKGAVLASSWITVIDESGAELGVKRAWANMPPWARCGPPPHLSDLNDPALALLQENWVATTSNFAMRRELVAEHGLRFSDLRYTHDWDFLLSAAALGRITVVDEPLLRYRVHGRNTIREGDADPAADALMRLEVLWTLGRHSTSIIELAAQRGFDRRELESRAARSQPAFNAESLLIQLRALRGEGVEVPEAYDDLLRVDHPWREAALNALAAAAQHG